MDESLDTFPIFACQEDDYQRSDNNGLGSPLPLPVWLWLDIPCVCVCTYRHTSQRMEIFVTFSSDFISPTHPGVGWKERKTRERGTNTSINKSFFDFPPFSIFFLFCSVLVWGENGVISRDEKETWKKWRTKNERKSSEGFFFPFFSLSSGEGKLEKWQIEFPFLPSFFLFFRIGGKSNNNPLVSTLNQFLSLPHQSLFTINPRLLAAVRYCLQTREHPMDWYNARYITLHCIA